jgi:hypothetical protein
MKLKLSVGLGLGADLLSPCAEMDSEDIQQRLEQVLCAVQAYLDQGAKKALRRCSTACRAIVDSHLTTLEGYSIGGHPMSMEAMRALASMSWPKLSYLNLQMCELKMEAIEVLASSSWTSLTSLNLSYNNVGVSGLAVLVNGPWKGLKALDLRWGKITEGGMAVLAQAEWPLEMLWLASNDVGSGVGALASAAWLGGLRELDLSCTGLTTEAMVQLQQTHFEELLWLQVGRNFFSENGIAALTKWHCPMLVWLDSSYNSCKVGTYLCFWHVRKLGNRRLLHVYCRAGETLCCQS